MRTISVPPGRVADGRVVVYAPPDSHFTSGTGSLRYSSEAKIRTIVSLAASVEDCCALAGKEHTNRAMSVRRTMVRTPKSIGVQPVQGRTVRQGRTPNFARENELWPNTIPTTPRSNAASGRRQHSGMDALTTSTSPGIAV